MESSLDSEQLVIGYANSRQSPIDAGMVLRGILIFLFAVSDRVVCVSVCECYFFFERGEINIKFNETIKRVPPGSGQDQDQRRIWVWRR